MALPGACKAASAHTFVSSSTIRAGPGILRKPDARLLRRAPAGRCRRSGPARAAGPVAFFGWSKNEEEVEAAPRPNERFTKKDLLRIKRQGPTVNDLVHKHIREDTDPATGIVTKTEFLHVPNEVLGNASYMPEPDWYGVPQVSIAELLRGLRERNWTNKMYNPNAEPWTLDLFADSGRFIRPTFSGYRAVVTKADGSRMWCNLPEAGPQNFLQDYSSGGDIGAINTAKREPIQPGNPLDYGYNQIFREIFEAYEQRLPYRAKKALQLYGSIDPAKVAYDCPADRLLNLSYQWTPPEPNLSAVWDRVPALLFFSFAFSFLGICLAIGIFRPRKMMPGDPVQAMEFAQSKGKARREGMTDVRFSDVAGLDQTVVELKEVVKFLQNPKQYSQLNAKPPKGVLLEGGPGTGKTLVAKAIAGESQVPFYQMSGSEFVEVIVGVGAARVRDLFKRARVNAPCIIFVDEIDALGIRRAEAGMRTNEEREQTLNQLLTEMDGFTPDIGVVFVAATNRADLLDPALMRAGRFDRKVKVSKPDTQGRADILKVHARKHPIGEDVNFEQIARDLPGLSGAELANILNESALEAIRREGDVINSQDVYNAIDRILQGVRRPGLPNDMEMKRAIAYHEGGKGIVATVLRQRHGKIEEVERVSVVPRGKDLSRIIFLRGSDDDYIMTTRSRLLERIRVLIAGRAAEDVHYLPSHATTYGVLGIGDVYKLAEKAVTSYGMSHLGITTWAPASSGPSYMQRSFEPHVDNIDADLFGNAIPAGFFQPSNSALYKIKSEVHNIINDAYSECVQILEAYHDALHAVVDELLKEEQVTGSRLEQILEEHPPKSGEEVATSLADKNLSGGMRLGGEALQVATAAQPQVEPESRTPIRI